MTRPASNLVAFEGMYRFAEWASPEALLLGALLLALTVPACDPGRDLAKNTLQLGDYCRSLKVGDMWSPQDARPRKIQLALEVNGGVQTYVLTNGGVSRCDVEYDPASRKIRALLYHPD
jgi:hypothetical protein